MFSCHQRPRAVAGVWRCGTLVLALAVALLISPPPSVFALHADKSPAPGSWTTLGAADRSSRAAMLRMANGHDLVAWRVTAGGKQTYDVAELSQNGGIAVGARAFLGGKDWPGGLSQDPALLFMAGHPLMIFSGQGTGKYSLGCIVGAVRSGSVWTLQPWSLSSGCTFANVGFWGGAASASAG